MSQQKKYFGTDGIRSEVGVGMIRPEQVLKLGWATGKVLKNHGESTVLIGKDTRISGYMFESALEAGFISAGINVLLVGPMPTPAVAYLTQTFGADVGIVISASHNPHCDNGIKFFSAKGQKISDEVEFEIEAAFEEDLITVPSNALGRAKRIEDAAGRYIEFCKSTYHARQKLSGLKVVLDCAHGATYHVAPAVFKELGAEVVSIGVEPNGININQHCGATDLAQLSNKVLEVKADLGIAFDGDGDRVMMVDVDGEIVDGDEILYILATQADYLVEGVVGTVMSNLGLEKALLQHNIELVRVNVGDRYVMQALKEKGWILGAEASGHVLSLDQSTTGDGIVSALQVMAALMNSGQSLTELRAGMYKYPQIVENIRVDNPKVVANSMVVESAVQASEQRMAGQGRVLVRASGTEPLIRIMVEGETLEVVEREVAWLADLVRTEFC